MVFWAQSSKDFRFCNRISYVLYATFYHLPIVSFSQFHSFSLAAFCLSGLFDIHRYCLVLHIHIILIKLILIAVISVLFFYTFQFAKRAGSWFFDKIKTCTKKVELFSFTGTQELRLTCFSLALVCFIFRWYCLCFWFSFGFAWILAARETNRPRRWNVLFMQEFVLRYNILGEELPTITKHGKF